MPITLKTWRRLLLFLLFGICATTTYASSATRIVLDRSTFPKISRPLLQETADQVAKAIDDLIPGDYPKGRAPKILCFVANGNWGNQPRAFVGKPWKIEPAGADKYDMRVALTPEVLPGAWQRLVFQLAHELTHHKMDATVDNDAMEAFAVAVSLETLHRLGYDFYRKGNERYYSQLIPREVMSALNQDDWEMVGLYLRYEWRHVRFDEWDRSTQFVAAMALRKMGNFPWARLLNIGSTAQCSSHRPAGRAQYCPLSPASLEGFPQSVRALLWKHELNVAIIHTGSRPESGGLSFHEKGKWVSLRWQRKSDPLTPEGFVPVD